jgi:hypothetical protein
MHTADLQRSNLKNQEIFAKFRSDFWTQKNQRGARAIS